MDIPCRQLERSAVSCPTCGKQLQLKSLIYSHKCRQSFRLEDRVAAVQQRHADEAKKREIAARAEEAARLEEARRLVQAHGESSRGVSRGPAAGDLILASLRSLAR